MKVWKKQEKRARNKSMIGTTAGGKGAVLINAPNGHEIAAWLNAGADAEFSPNPMRCPCASANETCTPGGLQSLQAVTSKTARYRTRRKYFLFEYFKTFRLKSKG